MKSLCWWWDVDRELLDWLFNDCFISMESGIDAEKKLELGKTDTKLVDRWRKVDVGQDWWVADCRQNNSIFVSNIIRWSFLKIWLGLRKFDKTRFHITWNYFIAKISLIEEKLKSQWRLMKCIVTSIYNT